MANTVKELFITPIDNYRKSFIILYVAVIFIFVPQDLPTDWDLNTVGFWSDIPRTFKNPSFVYPPWGLILMLPYKFMRAEGVKFFSVLVVGWLAIRQKWSLLKFFAIVLSPYFLVTMFKSNMDIFVFVLPILLWEAAVGTRWQNIGRGSALSILLLKPQGAVFIWFYLIWNSREKWKELIIPFITVALVTIPVSLFGTPSLITQWLHNVTQPSEQNQLYWSSNNISLATRYTLPGAVLILISVSLILLLLVRLRKIVWSSNHTIASLLIMSMFLSPYASQQSISPALAFVPSWRAVVMSAAGLIWGSSDSRYFDILPLWVLILTVSSFLFFIPQKN
jgi:hypothetical protein